MASDTTHRSSEIALIHPFVGRNFITPDNIRDALDNCVAVLRLLSRHFLQDDDGLFDCAQVRRGMFLQLETVTDLLESIEACLGEEDKHAREELEAEHEAKRQAEQAQREMFERVANDPENIAKQIALSKAFANAIKTTFGKERETPQSTGPEN